MTNTINNERIELLNSLHEQVTPEDIFYGVQKMKSVKNFDSKVVLFIDRMISNEYGRDDIVACTNHYYHVSEDWIRFRFEEIYRVTFA